VGVLRDRSVRAPNLLRKGWVKRRQVFDLRCAVSLRLTEDCTPVFRSLTGVSKVGDLKDFRKVAGKSETCRASEVKDLTCKLKIPREIDPLPARCTDLMTRQRELLHSLGGGWVNALPIATCQLPIDKFARRRFGNRHWQSALAIGNQPTHPLPRTVLHHYAKVDFGIRRYRARFCIITPKLTLASGATALGSASLRQS
jgi:hypothetical protein